MPSIPTENLSASENTSGKSYLIPFILVTSLFFLWGLANILNSALIAQFQPVFEIKRAQALLVETAFYFGYFTIALPAGFFLEKYGYKKGIILGLILYAVGALLFIPSAKILTFGMFLLALYVIASGLAFLETAANPYVTILGDSKTAVQRLNFSQSFNGLALVVGPFISGQFIFAGNEGSLTSLVEKQNAANAVIGPYMFIAVTVLLLAFLFWMIKMPEPQSTGKLFFSTGIFRHRHLTMAIIAQLFYVGAQAGIWGISINYIIELLPGTTREVASKHYLVIGTSLFVAGRFLGTLVMTFIKDHKLLVICALSSMVLCACGIFASGNIAVYAILAINLFMSIMFPTIFALGVKNLGEETKLGSSFIIMAIVGGAIVPPVMGLMADSVGIQESFVIPLVCFLFVVYYGWSGYREVKG